jgi:hypothetical protein
LAHAQIPWDGPEVRVVEHQAHAPGHAALLIEEHGVLLAADMLSDVLIPMLDLNDTADPIQDYLAALRLLEGVAGDVDVLTPECRSGTLTRKRSLVQIQYGLRGPVGGECCQPPVVVAGQVRDVRGVQSHRTSSSVLPVTARPSMAR